MNREDILRRIEEIRLLRNWDLPNDLGLPDPDYAGAEYDRLLRLLQAFTTNTDRQLDAIRVLSFKMKEVTGKHSKAHRLATAFDELDDTLCSGGSIPADWR